MDYEKHVVKNTESGELGPEAVKLDDLVEPHLAIRHDSSVSNSKYLSHLTTFGIGLLIDLKQDTNIPSWIFLCLIGGVGTGVLISAQGFAVQSSVVSADLPFASALYSFFRAFVQGLGVAIAGVIFQNTFRKKIEQSAYAEFAQAWSSNASAFVQVVKEWSSDGDEGVMKAVVVQAYVKCLQTVWIVMCVLAGVAFIASLIFMKELSLDRDLDTDQGFRHNGERPAADSEVER